MIDYEALLTDVGNYLKSNYNNELSAINAEKGNTVPLIDTNKMWLDPIKIDKEEFEVCIVYGMEDQSILDSTPISTLTRLEMGFTIALKTHGAKQDEDNNVLKMLRYQRALIATLQNDKLLSLFPQNEFTIAEINSPLFGEYFTNILLSRVKVNLKVGRTYAKS